MAAQDRRGGQSERDPGRVEALLSMSGGKPTQGKPAPGLPSDELSFPIYHTQHTMTDTSLNNPLRVKTESIVAHHIHKEPSNLAGTQKIPFPSSLKPHLATTSVHFAKGGLMNSAKYPGGYDNLHKYKLHHDRQKEYLKQLSENDKRSTTTQKNLPLLATIATVTSNGGFYHAHHHLAAAPLASSKPIHEEVSEDQQSLHEGEVLATLKQSKYKNRPNSSKMSKRHQTAPNGLANSAVVQPSRSIGLEVDPSKECSGIEIKFNRRKAETLEPSQVDATTGGPKSNFIPGSKLDADFLNLFSK